MRISEHYLCVHAFKYSHTKEQTTFISETIGEYKVTLLIYSGLPDPVWTIGSQNKKFQQIKELLDDARAKGNTFGYKNIPPLLGFRGFLVQQSGAHGEELILGKETGDLQKLLLDTMPKESIKDNLRQKILQAIDLGAVSPRVPDATQDSLASASSQVPSKEDKGGVGVIQHYAPKYNPDRWNKIQVILQNNNCYNYANQKITNSFAQPGYASGYKPYPYPMTPGNVIKACESDGLVKMDVDPSAPCPKAPPQPNCLIALLVAKGKKIITSCFSRVTINNHFCLLLSPYLHDTVEPVRTICIFSSSYIDGTDKH